MWPYLFEIERNAESQWKKILEQEMIRNLAQKAAAERKYGPCWLLGDFGKVLVMAGIWMQGRAA